MSIVSHRTLDVHRPGSQPSNQISPTFSEQFARVFQPPPIKPLPKELAARVRLVSDQAILDLISDLAKFVDERIEHALSGRNGIWRGH